MKVIEIEHFWKLMSPPIKSDTIGVVVNDRKVVQTIRQAQARGMTVYLRAKGRKA